MLNKQFVLQKINKQCTAYVYDAHVIVVDANKQTSTVNIHTLAARIHLELHNLIFFGLKHLEHYVIQTSCWFRSIGEMTDCRYLADEDCRCATCG